MYTLTLISNAFNMKLIDLDPYIDKILNKTMSNVDKIDDNF